MGAAVEQKGGIALALNNLDAAGIDYERKQDPPPEPASPFLDINDPRVDNDIAPFKSTSPPKENGTKKPPASTKADKPKTSTGRNETQGGLRPPPRAARERPSPPVSPKTIPAKQQQEGQKKPIGKTESKREPKAAPTTKASTTAGKSKGKSAPLQSSAKPGPPQSSTKPASAPSDKKRAPTPISTKPVPASSGTKPEPASSGKKPVPASNGTKPAPVSSGTKPAPASSGTKPAPASSGRKPAPASSDTKPAPESSGRKPAPASSDTKPAPESSSKKQAPPPSGTKDAPTPDGTKPAPLQTSTKPRPAPADAKPSPATPATTASPLGSMPQRKSRWKIFNFLRTPGPGPGPVSLPALQEKLALHEPGVKSPAPETPAPVEPETPDTKAQASATKSPTSASKPPTSASKPPTSASKSPTSATKPPTSTSKSPVSVTKTSGTAIPKKPRVPSQSLDPSPAGSSRDATLQDAPSAAQESSKTAETKALPSADQPSLCDKCRSSIPPPQHEPEEIPELGEPSPGLQLLDVDIPDTSLDRFSVMFSTVLQPRYSALMLRRKAHLEQLRVPNNPKVSESHQCRIIPLTFGQLPGAYKNGIPGERAPPKPPGRRQTVPSPKASPSLSLYPTIPPSIASRRSSSHKASPLVQTNASTEDIPPLPSPKFFSSSEVAKAASTRKATPQKLSMLSNTTRSSMSPESVKDRWTSDTSPTSTEATPTDEVDAAPGHRSAICSSVARDSGASTYPFKLELPIMMPEPIIGRISPTPSRGREETKAESTKSVESSRVVPLKLETMPPTPEPAMFEPVGLDFTRLEPAKSDPLKPEPLNVRPASRRRSPDPQRDTARDVDAIMEAPRPPRSSSLKRPPRPADPANDADAVTEAPRPDDGSSLKRQPSLKRQASMKKQPPTPSASAPSPARLILKTDAPVTASPRTIDIPKRKPSKSQLSKTSTSATPAGAASDGPAKKDSAKDGASKDATPPSSRKLAASASAQQLKQRTPQKLSSPVSAQSLTQPVKPTKTPSSSAPTRLLASQNLQKNTSSASITRPVLPRPDPATAPKLSDHPALRRAPSQSAKMALLTPSFDAPLVAAGASAGGRTGAAPPTERPTSGTSSIVAEVSLARQISLSRRQQVLTEVAPKPGGAPGTPSECAQGSPEPTGGAELDAKEVPARRRPVVEGHGLPARYKSERAVVESA